MQTITRDNYKSIKSISDGDIILFPVSETKTLKYRVECSHLSNVSDNWNNDKVFKELEIHDKNDFCTKSYGYRCRSGCFPETVSSDKDALYRVMFDLFEVAETKFFRKKTPSITTAETNPVAVKVSTSSKSTSTLSKPKIIL